MNNLINSILNWFKNPTVTSILVVLLAFAIGLSLFFYGVTLKNHISKWWYNRGTEQAHEEIQKLTAEAAAAKRIAAEALKALEQEKQVTAAEKAKREFAEQLLNDKTKTANQKLKEYEAALNKVPTVSPPANVDALCERAKALGINCE